jgi:hypothetical protein
MKYLDVPKSGSIAGTTHSHNRAGQYTRNRRSPVQPRTSRQTTIRAQFAAGSSAWATLASALQAAWVAYADAFPITDSLGQSIKLTGHQMFVAIQTNLANAGLAASTAVPVSNAVFGPAPVTFSFSHTSGGSITFTAGGASDKLLVAYSKPMSPGRSFNRTFQQQTTVAGTGTPVAITTAAYGAIFGTPTVGQKIFARVTPVNQYGVAGAPVFIAAIVS